MSRDNQGESTEVKVGKLETRMDGIEDKTKTNWKNLNSKIDDIKTNMEKQSEDIVDIKNSLATLTGTTQATQEQLSTTQEQLLTTIACLEKIGIVESDISNTKTEIKQIKKDVEGLRSENIEIRKTKITAWASIAVAIITGVLSIIALVIKK